MIAPVDSGEAIGGVVQELPGGQRQRVEVGDLRPLLLVHDLTVLGTPRDAGGAIERLAPGRTSRDLLDRVLRLAAHDEVDPTRR